MRAVSFKALFDEHTDFVWRVLRRHGVPVRELEDACQEVFLVVFRRLSEFEGRSSLRTWIYGIAVRIAIAFRRRAFVRRELLGADSPEASTEHEVVDIYAQRDAQLLLHGALSELPRIKREVFVLYELEGMTVAETASALGVPENTALYRLHSARKTVAASLRRRMLTDNARTSGPRPGSMKKGAAS